MNRKSKTPITNAATGAENLQLEPKQNNHATITPQSQEIPDKEIIRHSLPLNEAFAIYGYYTIEQGNLACPFCKDGKGKTNAKIDFNYFYCFGCKRSYDLFSFTMEQENCSFKDSKYIAAKHAKLIDCSPEELEFANLRRLDAEERREQDNQNKIAWQTEAAENAKKLLASGEKVKSFPYCEKKHIGLYDLTVSAGRFLVPMYNSSFEVVNVQMIDAQGNKPCLPSGQVKGCFYIFGDISKGDKVYIVEGFATGATVHELTGQPVIVAFTAYNLKDVALIFIEKHPLKEFIIASDHDERKLWETSKTNTGLVKGEEAARAIKAKIAYPKLKSGGKCDFNDVFIKDGSKAAKAQLEAAIPPPPQISIAVECPVQHEPPLPLNEEYVQQKPFPVECLGEKLSRVAQTVSRGTGIDLSAVASTMLAALSVCSQGLANVVLNGRETPLSLFFQTIAKSGCGKTTLDTILTKAIRQFESDARQTYEQVMHNWNMEMQAFNAEAKNIQNNKNIGLEERKAQLKALGMPPKKPRELRFLYSNPTTQGIFRKFKESIPSLGIFASEGAIFFGGHSMKKENFLSTIGIYADIFSTGRSDKLTASEDGKVAIDGVRLTMNIMLQHVVALPLFADVILMNQGILARFLVNEIPEKAMPYNDFDMSNDIDLQYFYNVCKQLLSIEFQYNQSGGLVFRDLYLKPEAKSIAT